MDREFVLRMQAVNLMIRREPERVRSALYASPTYLKWLRRADFISCVFLPAFWLAVGILLIRGSLVQMVGVAVLAAAVSHLFPIDRVVFTIVSVGLCMVLSQSIEGFSWDLLPPVLIALVSALPLLYYGSKLILVIVRSLTEDELYVHPSVEESATHD